MLIQCTKKLLEELKVKPEAIREENPLFDWHANLLSFNRRKTVVLVNDHSRYVVVLHGLKAKDFKQLDQLIVEGIRKTLENEGIKPGIIEKYLQSSGELIFTKTKDRTSVARMNKSCDEVHYFADLLDSNIIINERISKKVSGFMVGAGKGRYIYPNRELYQDLENLAGEKIFSLKAVQLKVTLDLDDLQVWRRLIVPLNREFQDLHMIIQKAFNWKDYHLHDFYLYDECASDVDWSPNHSGYHKDGYRAVLNLVSDEGAFAYPVDLEMILGNDVKLSEFLPKHKHLKYNYDFGDNWEHYIEVEKILENQDVNYPICLDGEGQTPPEDVGGSSGYAEFLSIMENPDHPDYQHMVKWAEMQGYKDFDIKDVNWWLKKW